MAGTPCRCCPGSLRCTRCGAAADVANQYQLRLAGASPGCADCGVFNATIILPYKDNAVFGGGATDCVCHYQYAFGAICGHPSGTITLDLWFQFGPNASLLGFFSDPPQPSPGFSGSTCGTSIGVLISGAAGPHIRAFKRIQGALACGAFDVEYDLTPYLKAPVSLSTLCTWTAPTLFIKKV